MKQAVVPDLDAARDPRRHGEAAEAVHQQRTAFFIEEIADRRKVVGLGRRIDSTGDKTAGRTFDNNAAAVSENRRGRAGIQGETRLRVGQALIATHDKVARDRRHAYIPGNSNPGQC